MLYLDVPEDEIVRRLAERGRADDEEATVRTRLEVFRKMTSPVLEFYRQRRLLREIDGTGEVEQVARLVQACVDTLEKKAG